MLPPLSTVCLYLRHIVTKGFHEHDLCGPALPAISVTQNAGSGQPKQKFDGNQAEGLFGEDPLKKGRAEFPSAAFPVPKPCLASRAEHKAGRLRGY
jgi:hypothetical protein